MNIQTVLENRAKAWEAAKAFLDGAERDGNGNISAEDMASYEKMENAVAELTKQADLYNRQKAVESGMTKPMENGKAEDAKTGTASGSYSKAFWSNMRARFDKVVYNDLKEGVDTAGGYLVPDEYERKLLEAQEEANTFRQLGATAITTQSGDRTIPIVVSQGEASWVDEAGLIPEADNAFGTLTLSAYKLATRIKASWELVQDMFFDLEGYITREFARRMSAAEEKAFISGDGNKKPTGIVSNAGVGITAASGTAIAPDELIDLVYALKTPYRPYAKFLMNNNTIKSIRKAKDSSGQYLWQPALVAGNPDRLLGYPIYTSPAMPEIAAGAKSVLFGDFSWYWIADRKGVTFQRLNELYAETGQVGWLAWKRTDGRLLLPEAVQALKQA
jgi:HK97 family phage major capsid protein